MGGMEFKGLAAEILYYKDFQDKYGFKMEVVRHGKYKSAVEPYLENEMSEANRIQIAALLDGVWGTISEEITESRNLRIDEVNRIAEDLKASLPQQAQENGLIDALIYENDYSKKLKAALGIENDSKLKKSTVNQLTRGNGLRKKGVRERIAVIYAQGPLIYGKEAKI